MTTLEHGLNELKQQLIGMAGNVEKAIELATEALLEWDSAKIGPVFEIEKRINQSHLSVDDGCVKLLALHQPLAVDLRLIIATLKISTDLERMGDQAVNIAHNATRYLNAPPLKPLVDLPKMSHDVRLMVRDSIDSFVSRSELKSREILLRDDRVDAFKNKIFRDVVEHLKAHPGDIEQGLNLILIARNLERIGDHATNIAEDVIFAITGEDIRHSPRAETIKESLK
ncbi:phosphate signaling complex protein PhoU [Bdellovibrionota bacterium FG-1]